MAAAPAAAGPEVSARRGVAVVSAVALGATLLMAAPVALAPAERLFGSRTFARDDPNRDPLVVIEQLRTGHVPGPYLQPLTDLPGRALARLLGPVVAYNVLVLATFPLSAGCAYLLARYAVGSHLAAMVAGLAYAFLPFHVAHASNHPHVAQTQWLPLFFLALWRCVDRPDVSRGLVLVAAAASVALSNFYAGLVAAVLAPVALVAYAVVSPRRPPAGRWRRLAVTGLTLAAASAVGLLLVHQLAPAVLGRPSAFAFPRSDLFLHSAKWWSYLVPPIDHPAAGSWARKAWTGSGLEGALLEQQVGVGWSLVALAAVPLWHWLRGDRSSLAVRSVPVLAILAGAAMLCSLSPERTIGALTFVRPSALLYEIAPMFRAYARFGVVVGLVTALLAGAGAARLWRSSPAGRRAAAILVALAALEFAPFPPWRWRDVLPTRAHRWLADRPGPFRVLDCVPPLRVSDSLAVPLLGHEVTLLDASGREDCGEPRLAEKLEAQGYTHVIERRNGAPRTALDRHPAGGLTRIAEFDDAAVLGIDAAVPPAYVDAMLGFHPRESDGHRTWRWMPQTGGITVLATRAADLALELEMKAFPGDRRVQWWVDGRRMGELQVAADWGRYELPLGTMVSGQRATLTLGCDTAAVVADDILRNDDRRALAVAVADWGLRTVRPGLEP